MIFQVHYNGSELTVNITNFNSTYTLGNLSSYTTYSVYVTAVRLVEGTGELLESDESRVVTERTLAGGTVKHFSLFVVKQNEPSNIYVFL